MQLRPITEPVSEEKAAKARLLRKIVAAFPLADVVSRPDGYSIHWKGIEMVMDVDGSVASAKTAKGKTCNKIVLQKAFNRASVGAPTGTMAANEIAHAARTLG
jgi:hypothetical protein